MKKNTIYIFACMYVFLCGCSKNINHIVSMDIPVSIYPDYTDIVIPYNIAPLNFMTRESIDKIEVKIKGANDSISVSGKNKIIFPETRWRSLLTKEKGHKLTVSIQKQRNDSLFIYPDFYWDIAEFPIDRFLSYRLIEPGFEVWNKIKLEERDLEGFSCRTIADNNDCGGSCMNCHTYGNNDGNLSLFHIRGEKGGTILNRNGKLQKLNIKNNKFPTGAVYGNIHPEGKYAVFSTNQIIPEFHTKGNKRLEVYDQFSQLFIAEFDSYTLSSHPDITDSSKQYTFPTFSPDGNSLYFCEAQAVSQPDSLKSMYYSLCKIGFNTKTGKLIPPVNRIWEGGTSEGSASFPKISPDGKYLLFCVSDYGTFPIWHQETDLRLLDLETGVVGSLDKVNSDRSDTYHSWSSSSKWFVFASKRDDGLYGKPFFSFVDGTGKAYKPFVLPQKDPEFYDLTLKSFNIPELSKTALPFDKKDIKAIYQKKIAKTFKNHLHE